MIHFHHAVQMKCHQIEGNLTVPSVVILGPKKPISNHPVILAIMVLVRDAPERLKDLNAIAYPVTRFIH